MILIVSIMSLILLAGPLRPWALRNWFVLASVVVGAVGGLLFGGLVVTKLNYPIAELPLIFAVAGAIAVGQKGLSISRDFDRRNRNERDSRRH
jgi:uncharacterized membrane protein